MLRAVGESSGLSQMWVSSSLHTHEQFQVPFCNLDFFILTGQDLATSNFTGFCIWYVCTQNRGTAYNWTLILKESKALWKWQDVTFYCSNSKVTKQEVGWLIDRSLSGSPRRGLPFSVIVGQIFPKTLLAIKEHYKQHRRFLTTSLDKAVKQSVTKLGLFQHNHIIKSLWPLWRCYKGGVTYQVGVKHCPMTAV